MMKQYRIYPMVIIGIIVLAIDQLTKYLVLTNLKPINAVTVIDGILQFRYVENTGAAFGIFSDKTELLSAFTAIIIPYYFRISAKTAIWSGSICPSR